MTVKLEVHEDDGGRNPDIVLTVGNGVIVAEMGGGPLPERRANARRLALAWNCHADLFRALTAASHALHSYAHGNASPELAAEVAAVVDEAIAKAKGERS